MIGREEVKSIYSSMMFWRTSRPGPSYSYSLVCEKWQFYIDSHVKESK